METNFEKKIKEVIEKTEEEKNKDKKPKKFKLPFKGRLNKTDKNKNMITVMKINENGYVDFVKLPIVEQTVMVDGIPRLASAGYVLHYNKEPILVIPNWTVEPFSPMEHYNLSLNNGSNTKGYKLLMNRMQSSIMEKKPAMIGGMIKWIIGIGLAAVIGYALISGG
jgi:hypothetical protein